MVYQQHWEQRLPKKPAHLRMKHGEISEILCQFCHLATILAILDTSVPKALLPVKQIGR